MGNNFLVLEQIGQFDLMQKLEVIGSRETEPEAERLAKEIFSCGRDVMVAEIKRRMVREYDPR